MEVVFVDQTCPLKASNLIRKSLGGEDSNSFSSPLISSNSKYFFQVSFETDKLDPKILTS